jgi:CTP-dependent riboflavin kinase
MASTIKVTERTVHRVLVDLERGGYISRQSTGKGNISQISREYALKYELTRDSVVAALTDLSSRKKKRKRLMGSRPRCVEKDE